MSIPYESNATTIAQTRVIDAFIDHPFAADGDTVTKEYKMICSCKISNYSAPTFAQTMSSATIAKVIQLPFPADAAAYFVGDEGFSPSSGEFMTFTRTFARVGATRTRGIGSYSNAWPAFREWDDATQTTNAVVFPPPFDLPPRYLTRNNLTASSPAKITYTYTYATAIENVAKDVLWNPKWVVGITYPHNQTPTDYVCDSGSGGQPYGTTPTLTQYQYNYINKLYVVVESRIKSYKGNIFVRETIQALAQ